MLPFLLLLVPRKVHQVHQQERLHPGMWYSGVLRLCVAVAFLVAVLDAGNYVDDILGVEIVVFLVVVSHPLVSLQI